MKMQLDGFRIGVTSDRRSAELIAALERRGAAVLHAPTIRMAEADDDAQVVAQTQAIIDARPDVLLATTGYGIRRWLELADAAGLGEQLIEALTGCRILTRGPKARGAIRAAGLDDAGMSEIETTASLVDLVLAGGVAGQRVAVQEHGHQDSAQLGRLTEAGAEVLAVAPYGWRPHDDSRQVGRLIDAVCVRQLDAVTFTSAPAVEALFGFAGDRLAQLQEAFRSDVMACAVGPVTAEPLVAAGITPISPDRFRMGAMIRVLGEELERHRGLRPRTQQEED